MRKKGIESFDKLDDTPMPDGSPTEKQTFQNYNAILGKEALTLDDIKQFCATQIDVIESKWKDLNLSTEKKAEMIPYHSVYKSLLAAVDSPRSARENLEKYLIELTKQKYMSQETVIRIKKSNGDEVIVSGDSAGNLLAGLGSLIAGEDLTADVLKVENRANYQNISTGVGTAVKSTAGFLHGISINNAGTAWEIDVYDGTASSGTLIAKIRGTTLPTSLQFDVAFAVGLFIDSVKGTTVGDLTVEYR